MTARQCPATSKQTGQQCKRMLAPGQVVCKWHGGGSPQAIAKQEERNTQAEVHAELDRLGVPADVDPGEALLAMVAEAAGNVAYLRSRVQQLPGDDLYGPVDYDKPKAEPHVLVRMYDAERDRLANVAALTLKAGVDERRVRMAEATGERLFDAITKAHAAAGLTPEQQEAIRSVLADELRAL